MKYKVQKLNNEEYTASEIDNLIKENKLSKDDLVSENGNDWVKASEILPRNEDATFLLNLNDLEEQLSDKPKEFVFDHIDPFENDVEIIDEVEEEVEEIVEEIVEEGPEESTSEEEVKTVDPDSTETKVQNEKAAKEEVEADSDKTQINKLTIDYLEELKKQKEQEDAAKEEEEQRLKEEEEQQINYKEDATQVLDLNEVRGDLLSAIKEDVKFQQEAAKETLKEKKAQKSKETVEEVVEDKPKRKPNLIIISVVILIVGFILLGEDNDTKPKVVKVTPITPSINFPVQFEVINEEKAKKLYIKGLKEYRKGNYRNLMKAANYFRESAENSFRKNPAVGRLIATYSRMLLNSDQRGTDANVAFKLVQIFKSKILSDPSYASAYTLFYYVNGKLDAAQKTVEKFLSLESNKPSLELFAVYLDVLVAKGEFIKAAKVAEKISKQKKKDVYSYKALMNFYYAQNEDQKLVDLLAKTKKKYSKSPFWQIYKGELLLKNQDWEGMKSLLREIKQDNAGDSRDIYASFLKFRGLYFVAKGKLKKGAKDLSKSLAIKEDYSLIAQLASLENATDSSANDLIQESRALDLLRKAKKFYKNGDTTKAFKKTLEVTAMLPKYIPARIFLSELQLEQGYMDDALQSLQSLAAEFKSSNDLLYMLTEANIRAYKFKEARRLLSTIVTLEKGQDDIYESLTAMFFIYKNDFNKSTGWLRKAINKNPINDKNIYELVKLLIKYKKFEKAKVHLKKAMDIDPSNIEYRLSFAEILYEVEGTTSAIGYLYDVLKDFPDSPNIMSAIGIYYYRSGQVKNFERMKAKLKAIPKKDVSLYRFLIEAAKLDDNYDKVIENCIELIKLKPGDLDTRLYLAQLYIEKEQYDPAVAQLKAIENRFATFPRLQYFIAKLRLLLGDVDLALKKALEEAEENPSVIDSFLLLGDIYKQKGELLKARDYYLQASKIDPKNVESMLGLAYVNFNSDKYDMALDQYIKAKEIEPNRAEIYRLLGDAYRKLGQSQLAITNYNYYLELSPNSRYKVKIQTYIKTME